MTRRTRDTGLTPRKPVAMATPDPAASATAAASASVAAGRPLRTAAPRETARAVRPAAGPTAPAAPAGRPAPRAASRSASPAAPTGRLARRETAGSPIPSAGPAPVSTDVPGDTLVLMTELTTLLEWENTELLAKRFSALSDTVARKRALSRAYQDKVLAFRRNPELASELDDARRTAMKAQSERLSTAMNTNGNLLRAGIDSVNLVMKNVVNAIQEHKAHVAPLYQGSGQLGSQQGELAHMALALNKEF